LEARIAASGKFFSTQAEPSPGGQNFILGQALLQFIQKPPMKARLATSGNIFLKDTTAPLRLVLSSQISCPSLQEETYLELRITVITVITVILPQGKTKPLQSTWRSELAPKISIPSPGGQNCKTMQFTEFRHIMNTFQIVGLGHV
jgi:hypothetical protein